MNPDLPAAPTLEPASPSVSSDRHLDPIARVAPDPRTYQPTPLDRLRAHGAIARPDHWFKNVFMALGILLAFFYHPTALHAGTFGVLLWAFATTCIVASSNYVINELLDAPRDRSHPHKRHRPVPSGTVILWLAYVQWIALGALGLALAAAVNRPFFWTSAALLVMGLVYNVPPVRSKELPYVDVLSESVNNPLRLMLGWFALSPGDVPPLSLIVAYWMIGAYFMATKRFAEYRSLNDKATAIAYRNSFRHYNADNLLISMVFYATVFALFFGVFIIRYHLELILLVPFTAGFISYYLFVALKPDSAVQHPERLYKEWGLMLYLGLCVVAFLGLMFVHIPVLYHWFNVEPSRLPALWRV